MLRVLFFVFALVFFFTGNTAWAQTSGNATWCTPIQGGTSANSCFPDPATACEAQNQSYNPDGGIEFIGA